MSLNGGLGDVTTKNILLTPPPTTEKLTAVKHCNGVDYWIIDHPFNSNTFNAYLLTSSGINLTPVVSNIGTMQSGTTLNTIGYLKASPNGKKLALGILQYIPILEIFDFNNLTGQISNPITITYPTYGVYGIAFSPDSYKIYATIYNGLLYQYDLSSNSASAIIASQTIIPDSIMPYNIGALQLAPNGKIYISVQDSTTLAVINNPNGLGLSCHFQLKGLSLSTGTKCFYGLPNFIEADNLYHSQSYNIPLCNFPSYAISVNGNSNYQWLNGDTTKSININTFGNYWVSFINSQGCKEVDTFHVTKILPPSINILHDTSQCSNLVSPLIENATDSNAISYLWNDGSISPIRTITSSGSYWVNYTLNNFCVSRDSFSYSINNIPSVNLGDDTTFCLGNLLKNVFNPSSSYLWSTGQTSSEITVTTPNSYWVKVTTKYGCINSDTLIVYPELSAFDFALPNIVTPDNDGINDFIDFGKYQFSSLQLDIYNRWGFKVFESNNPTCVWKPTEDDGIYYYTLNYIINCGIETQNKPLKGFITIVR
jgi:hypothetical protein